MGKARFAYDLGVALAMAVLISQTRGHPLESKERPETELKGTPLNASCVEEANGTATNPENFELTMNSTELVANATTQESLDDQSDSLLHQLETVSFHSNASGQGITLQTAREKLNDSSDDAMTSAITTTQSATLAPKHKQHTTTLSSQKTAPAPRRGRPLPKRCRYEKPGSWQLDSVPRLIRRLFQSADLGLPMCSFKREPFLS